jgi:CRISPR-associated endonuclease/helicase Cas3
MSVSYPEFFLEVTGHHPLPFQQRYGENPFSSTLLIIPTGLGKTDTVVLPWLYRRSIGDLSAPTRLILVLPRQNLTHQTASTARKHTHKAGLSDLRVLELMGGSGDNQENLGPSEPAIIVATQDLYFSRALNRGYARRPPRWPIDFALYNQDCLIVLDEIQLMNEALATSTQLSAFRNGFQTFGGAPCIWMSATVNPQWLATVDSPGLPPQIRLTAEDRTNPVVQKRTQAQKALAPAPPECRTPAGCAAFALAHHRPHTRTLVIANTVARAREIYREIHKKCPGAILLHSRFRPGDREHNAEALGFTIPAEGQIVVATQVLEAGVDISSRLLITDLAPWGSLVQRFGRVNRCGDDPDSEIWWVDEPAASKQKGSIGPYAEEDLRTAASRLEGRTSAAPADLPEEDGPEPYQHVLRRADLLDLFDTTPDISGNDLDVSRFIRAGGDRDVYLAWRNWPANTVPDLDEAELADKELCPVPIGEFREFMKKHEAFTVNFATEEWVAIDRSTPLYPGMLVMARAQEGGYTGSEGWSPESKTPVIPVDADRNEKVETDTSDRPTFQTYRQTLRAHTFRVTEKMEELLAKASLPEEVAAALRLAAERHDWGKAHEVFQETMYRGEDTAGSELLAKRCGLRRHKRKHFRHELASALAMLQTGAPDLAAYIAAGHHGRIRLGIRSMPGERERYVRGISEGDRLPACELAPGVAVPEVKLSLDCMKFGAEGGSWTDRMLRLLDQFGPFRLAYLEMILRAADEAASADQGKDCTACPSSN